MNKGYLDALSKSKIFLYSSLVFISGTACASFFPDAIRDAKMISFSLVISSASAIALFWKNKIIRLAGILCLFLFLSFWRYGEAIPINGPDKIWFYNGEMVEITGMVGEEPDEREAVTKLKIVARKLDGRDVSGTVLVTTNVFPKFEYGDELEVKCKLQKPEADNFPYDRYLARYDIYSVCFNPKIRILRGGSEGRGNYLYAWIYRIKTAVREKISSGLIEPEAGLAKGFILGDLKGIDNELSDKFSKSGLSHIVAISGANISIVAGLVMNLCFWTGLGRKKSLYLSIIFLVIYIILVGAPASAMRAGLMGFIVLWALYLGRINKSINALAFAAALMLFANPKLLLDDIGFQLSFLAIIGVVYIYPSINIWLEKIKIPNFLSIREAMGMTISAQILTIPIMIYNFGQVSTVAIPANILVSWTLLPLMIILPISISLSFVWSAMSWIIFLIPGLILRYVIFVAERSASLPYTFFQTYFKPNWIFIIFVYYIFWFWFMHMKNSKIIIKT